MDQNKRQAVALMRYSAIAPLIAGTQEDYESLQAYYRDVSAKGIKAPDGQIRHYSPGTIQKWHLAYKNAGFDGLLPMGRSDCGVSRKIDDALGEEIVEALEEHSLPYHLDRVEFPTGTVQVTLDPDGVPQYEIMTDVAWDNIPYTKELAALASDCRAVCFGSLAQRSEVSRETINLFLEAVPGDCLKVFDINLRQLFYTKEVLEESFRRCDILKINDDELEVISEMFACPGTGVEETCRHLMKEYGLKMLILTCGTRGSYVFHDGGTSFRDTPKVKVADTVGAGDSFTGAFVASVLNGESVGKAHAKAVEVSAFVCTMNGAMPEIPEEIKK